MVTSAEPGPCEVFDSIQGDCNSVGCAVIQEVLAKENESLKQQLALERDKAETARERDATLKGLKNRLHGETQTRLRVVRENRELVQEIRDLNDEVRRLRAELPTRSELQEQRTDAWSPLW